MCGVLVLTASARGSVWNTVVTRWCSSLVTGVSLSVVTGVWCLSVVTGVWCLMCGKLFSHKFVFWLGYKCVVFVSGYRCVVFVSGYRCVVFVSGYTCVVFVSGYKCVVFVSGYRCVAFLSSHRLCTGNVWKTVQSQGGGYRCVVFDVRKTVQSEDDVLVWIQVCGV